MSAETYFQDEQERWRNEVASRINSYKAKHKRSIEGQYSMKLDFEARQSYSLPPETPSFVHSVPEQKNTREVCDTNYYRRVNAEAMSCVAAAAQARAAEEWDHDFDFTLKEAAAPTETAEGSSAAAVTSALSPEATESLAPELDALFAPLPASSLAANNVILFPRPTVEPPLAPPPPTRDDLADRVFERPRILDVPEDNAPTIQQTLFADIHLDAEPEEMLAATRPDADFEIPLQVAPIVQRASAAACDWALVAVASLVFFVLSWKSLGDLPQTKAGAAALAIVPFVLWSVYQFLFHLYSGQTPGMQFFGLRLNDFHGEMPEWEQRKKRALYAVLSCASIGFGFLWALVDEDTLCWHDRASQTYLSRD
jgi:uncharacterized RDD family membrane protein YckC